MRNTYALLGMGFLILFAGTWLGVNRGFSPKPDTSLTTSSTTPMTGNLSLTSTAFVNGAGIPSKYTCDGQQVSPPLSIAGVPTDARSLVLIVDDPDVPKQLMPDGVYDHWVLFNIPAATTDIAEGTAVGIAGSNGSGKPAYAAPCPPTQYEPSEHRYIFSLYALDAALSLSEGASKQEVVDAMQGHILAQTVLFGRYRRQ